MANRRITVNATGEPITCDNKRIPAPLVEDAVLRQIAEARLPEDDIEAARAMLKERNEKPADDAAQTKRRRLEKAAEALRKQHAWGDLTDGPVPGRAPGDRGCAGRAARPEHGHAGRLRRGSGAAVVDAGGADPRV